jgi:hypothetical protein
VPAPRQIHVASTRLLAALMLLIGVALIVSTLARGGGALAVGVVMGALFVLAGAGRLYVAGRRG